MKNIAKMLSLLLAVVLVLGITACGGKESEENTTSSTAAPVTSVTEPLTSDPTTFVPPEEDNKSKENGELSNGVYKNKWADISFKMPDGWKISHPKSRLRTLPQNLYSQAVTNPR